LHGIRLRIVGIGGLLQEQVRHGTSEGVGRGSGFDYWLEVAILRIQPAEEVEDLTGFRNRMTDVAELVGDALELGAGVMDGEVALLYSAKLCFQEDGALELIVAEVPLDVGPEREGGDARLVDEVEDVGGDGGVYPVDKATVHLTPLGVTLGKRSGRTDMALQAELAEH
jgi:hypothetical protein